MKKRCCAAYLGLSIIGLMIAGKSFAQTKEMYSTDIMNGLSGKGANLTKPYISAGDRT